MPNWCHNTLTITGENDEVRRFAEAARPTESSLRRLHEQITRAYEQRSGTTAVADKPSLEEFIAMRCAAQPMSFASLVPEPSQEEYDAMNEANKVTCRYCAGKGKRPVTKEEADEWGIAFYDQAELPEVPFEERRDCNVCSGTGREVVGMGAWWDWRIANWGTKWDVNFDHGVMAMGTEDMDVETCLEANGCQLADGVVIYKFDTAWSPPSPFVEKASDQFPELRFELKYGEVGNGYAGREVYIAGLEVENEELEVDEVLAPEEQWF